MVRITQGMVAKQAVRSVEERYNKLAEAQRLITSGQAIDRVSDDPKLGGEVMELSSRSSRADQYLRNTQTVMQELRTVETSIGQVNELLSRVHQLALRASNQSLGEADRQAISTQVEQELGELLRIANQKSGGHYLFGGGIGGRAPFDAEFNEAGEASAITMNDSASVDPMQLAVGEGTHIKAGMAAGEFFQLENGELLMDVLVDLRDAIRSGDRDVVTGIVGRLDDAIDQTTSTTAMIGARVSSVQTASERLEDAKLEATTRLSEYSDADIVDAISRFNQEQAYYEMSLQATAKIIQPSLLNFI
jgi:flagellar hook-associated protein 3 FlgL